MCVDEARKRKGEKNKTKMKKKRKQVRCFERVESQGTCRTQIDGLHTVYHLSCVVE